MVVRKVFRIRIRTFNQAHRIAPHSHFAFAAHFSHFRTFLIFLLHVSQLKHQKVVKSAKKM
jgi:hypothetical protein